MEHLGYIITNQSRCFPFSSKIPQYTSIPPLPNPASARMVSTSWIMNLAVSWAPLLGKRPQAVYLEMSNPWMMKKKNRMMMMMMMMIIMMMTIKKDTMVLGCTSFRFFLELNYYHTVSKKDKMLAR